MSLSSYSALSEAQLQKISTANIDNMNKLKRHIRGRDAEIVRLRAVIGNARILFNLYF